MFSLWAIVDYGWSTLQYLANLLARYAADNGNGHQQAIVGENYYLGRGVQKDIQQALRWLRLAAEQGEPLAHRYLGLCYERGEGVEKDEGRAAEFWRMAAARNDPFAQLGLAMLYKEGRGVERNDEEAARLFGALAKQGNRFAQYELACCYKDGKGVSRDHNMCFEWSRKAADQGLAHAQVFVACFYEEGLSVSQDINAALRWYHKAGDQDHKGALEKLGDFYREGKGGVAVDLTKAAEFYGRSAQKDHPPAFTKLMEFDQVADSPAHFYIGCCHEAGFNDERRINIDLAEEKFILAVKLGNSTALERLKALAHQRRCRSQLQLGDCYREGLATQKNIIEAVKWYHLVAKQGNEIAFNSISDLAAQGDEFAQNILGECYEKGEGIAKDLNEASRWYREAAEKGSADGQNNYGRCFELGLGGVTKDDNEAINWYRMSAEQGNKNACMAILDLAIQRNGFAVSALDQLVLKDRTGMINITLQGFAREKGIFENQRVQLVTEHEEVTRNLNRAHEREAQLQADISRRKDNMSSTLTLFLSDVNTQDVDGNTPLMKCLLRFDPDVLAENADLLIENFDRSPWHAVNKEGRSLAEIIIDNRVPACIRDHARNAMELALNDRSAKPSHRSAADRALHPDDSLLPSSSSSSYFEIPFGDLRIGDYKPIEVFDLVEILNVIKESAKRIPPDIYQQLQSLIEMLHSVNTPEMRNLSRLEQLLPGLETRLEAINETRRWLSKNGNQDYILRVDEKCSLLRQQLTEIEPIVAEVKNLLPHSNVALSFEPDGRIDQITPKQVNDILSFIRRHHLSIVARQDAVLTASDILVDKLREYSEALRSAQGDLDAYHTFMNCFLAHINHFRYAEIPKALGQVWKVGNLLSNSTSEVDIQVPLEELRSIRPRVVDINKKKKDHISELEKKRALLSALQTKLSAEAVLSTRKCEDFRESMVLTESKIGKINSEIEVLQQSIDQDNQGKQSLQNREHELRREIVDKLCQSHPAAEFTRFRDNSTV